MKYHEILNEIHSLKTEGRYRDALCVFLKHREFGLTPEGIKLYNQKTNAQERLEFLQAAEMQQLTDQLPAKEEQKKGWFR